MLSANGFVRSEGTVAFFLQREQDAKRHYAKLLLCDNIFDGLSSHTLLGYDEEYVKNSLTQIYERNMNSLYPEDIGFVELTGCATKVILLEKKTFQKLNYEKTGSQGTFTFYRFTNEKAGNILSHLIG